MSAEEALHYFFGLDEIGDSSIDPSDISSASESQDESGNNEAMTLGYC